MELHYVSDLFKRLNSRKSIKIWTASQTREFRASVIVQDVEVKRNSLCAKAPAQEVRAVTVSGVNVTKL